MHPFARRPQSYIAPQDFADAQGVIQALHQLMDVPLMRPEPLLLDIQQMGYAGALLEDVRSFRPQGAAQLDAALPSLIQHAIATHHVGLLLCMKDATTNADMQQEITDAVSDMLDGLPMPDDVISADFLRSNLNFVRKKMAQAPLEAIHKEQDAATQLNAVQDDLCKSAWAENDFMYAGRLAMRAHRIYRLNEQINASAPHMVDPALVQRLKGQKRAGTALLLLGWSHAKPGAENALYAVAEALEADTDAMLLAALNQPTKPKAEKEPMIADMPPAESNVPWINTNYIRPSNYLPLELMTNVTMLRQLHKLAKKSNPSTIDQLRMGELLFGLQEMRGPAGRQLLQRETARLTQEALECGNIIFLHALGQATTEPGECITTLDALNKLMGDATRYIDPEFLAGQWYPEQSLQECDATLSKLVEDAEDWQGSLLGMSLARHQFLQSLDLDEVADHSYSDLEALAADQDNLLGMTAAGYAMTKPGKILVNSEQIHHMKNKLDGAGSLPDEFAELMKRAAEFGLMPDDSKKTDAPAEQKELPKWAERYIKAIQSKKEGGNGRFLQN